MPRKIKTTTAKEWTAHIWFPNADIGGLYRVQVISGVVHINFGSTMSPDENTPMEPSPENALAAQSQSFYDSIFGDNNSYMSRKSEMLDDDPNAPSEIAVGTPWRLKTEKQKKAVAEYPLDNDTVTRIMNNPVNLWGTRDTLIESISEVLEEDNGTASILSYLQSMHAAYQAAHPTSATVFTNPGMMSHADWVEFRANQMNASTGAAEQLSDFLCDYLDDGKDGVSSRMVDTLWRKVIDGARSGKATLQPIKDYLYGRIANKIGSSEDMIESFKQAMESKALEDVRDLFLSCGGMPADEPDNTYSKPINKRFVLFWGAPGSGKTTEAIRLAGGSSAVVVGCNVQTTIDTLIKAITVNPDNTSNRDLVVFEGPMYDCMTQGKVLVLDEMNQLQSKVLAELQAYLDNKDTVIETKTHTAIAIKEGFCIIGTMNLNKDGTRVGLPDALLDRAEIIREFHNSPENVAKSVTNTWDDDEVLAAAKRQLEEGRNSVLMKIRARHAGKRG